MRQSSVRCSIGNVVCYVRCFSVYLRSSRIAIWALFLRLPCIRQSLSCLFRPKSTGNWVLLQMTSDAHAQSDSGFLLVSQFPDPIELHTFST